MVRIIQLITSFRTPPLPPLLPFPLNLVVSTRMYPPSRFALQKMMRAVLVAALATALVVAPTPTQAAKGDIVDVAKNNGSFKTLVDFVTKANLVATLQQNRFGDNYMVLAPTDDAFKKLTSDQVDFVTSSPERLSGT